MKITDLRKHFVEEVFAKIPHRVGFKPYPSNRYVDPDPILNDMGQSPNVDVLTTKRDLRYLLRDTHMVMTTAASSTLSWCLCSDIPVIYIDSEAAGYRLADTLREEFARAINYLDARSKTFFEDLRLLLNRSIEEIEEDWFANHQGREQLYDYYMGAKQSNPGETAYHWLTGLSESVCNQSQA